MKIYADSGSTKTEWILLINNEIEYRFETIGMNPFFVKEKEIIFEIEKHLKKYNFEKIKELNFYGAGCSTFEKIEWLKRIFSTLFVNATINIKTDIEGAVLATSKKGEKSITSILGTGSAFRIFDGKNIIKKYSSLGYIIGDEGSGTHISKALLRRIMYQQLNYKLEKAFFEYFNTTREEIIENIYSKPFPNRYLAKFTKFCNKNIENEIIEKIVLDSFYSFFKNHISNIENYKNYKLHFIGSIAYYFQDQLKNVANEYDCDFGIVLQKPLQSLILKS